jgi:hypothetical protein
MSQVIRVSDSTFNRLEKLAVGFDTPNNVIERLLDHYGAEPHTEEVEDVKIGKLVRQYVEKILKQEGEIENLLSADYSKKTFGLYYAFAKEVSSDKKIHRYWKNIYTIDNRRFVVTNEWYERNRESFLDYLAQRGLA